MWPRVVELMLGVWLAASPFFFLEEPLGGFAAANALACSFLVIVASCLSYWEPTRHARALTAAVALWMTARAYVVASFPASPMVQNEFLVGLLLLMFAIVPNDSAQPPRSWRPHVAPQRRNSAGDPKPQASP